LSFDDDAPALPEEDGLALGELDLSGDEEASLDLGGDDSSDGLSLSDDDLSEELSLGGDDSEGLSLGGDDSEGLSLGGDEPSLDSDDGLSLNFGSDEDGLSLGDDDLSSDAKEKLKEIDAIMDLDASHVNISSASLKASENLDEPLVSEDLDLGSLNFSTEDEEEEVPVIKETPKKAKKKESAQEVREAARDRDMGEDLKEISGAYSGEMERMQATISNLRADREELLAKIQKLEDEKVMQGRGSLTMRAELDERKIELTIIRKKLNEEINELKDRIKLFDEKRLILEEKNRILMQELDKSAQKNKIDVKKVQMRERELEQRLELLKSDAESQIRHRDLKILELKRKIDGMEFDMESITVQEKRSVESRYELEDKLEKAIKTLRSAITVLEDESDRTNALDALKKNIDM
jgi:predicted amino acid-binding ACT domain protein